MTASDDVSSDAVALTLNGASTEIPARGDETLLETLRDGCGLTSVRYCCGIGVCGTCTVLLDGAAVSSCLLLTRMASGHDVVTAEGLAAGAKAGLSSVQQAFVEAGAFQCSYCIPGMALTVHAALDADPGASVERVCEELGGNLCRCGSYPQVREAVSALVAAERGDVADHEESS
jgi:aerobic-type carbon monoxide dehydrogenase small subunit (CoxS/CutS family)